MNIITEDLGFAADEVIELRERTGFPGMKILQLPSILTMKVSIAHTWRQTTLSCTQGRMITIRFLDGTAVKDWRSNSWYLARYTNRKEYETFHNTLCFVRFLLLISFSNIATMQDLLELDGSARMNSHLPLGKTGHGLNDRKINYFPTVEKTYDLTTIYRRSMKIWWIQTN